MMRSETSLVRQTSPSTGLSYLTNTSIQGPVKKLYLLIHGWGCTSLDYLPLLHVLVPANTDTQYIAVDLPGHGYSSPSLCPIPTVSGFAALLNRFCDEVCTAQKDPPHDQMATEDIAEKLSGTSSIPASDKALPLTSDVEKVIVGHSMGCRIALEVFAQEPANISGIVLLDGSWYGPNVRLDRIANTNIDEERQVILKSLGNMFGPSTPDQFKQQVAEHLQKIDLVYANQLSSDYVAWEGQKMEDVLRMVPENIRNGGRVTKVLIVQATDGHGATRRRLKKGEENAWIRLVRESVGERCRVLIVEDSGHWPHADRVDEIVQAVKNFGV